MVDYFLFKYIWAGCVLPAKPAKLPNQACLASRSLYSPPMSFFLGFQTKYIWNSWGILVCPVQLVLLYLSTFLDSWLAHCVSCSKKYALPISFLNNLKRGLIKQSLQTQLFGKAYEQSFLSQNPSRALALHSELLKRMRHSLGSLAFYESDDLKVFFSVF